ncbi:Coq4 family protein [Pseudomonadales bacterium]|nr:Coq4 family protein [Pseudomonadales bacterium]
MSNKPTIDRTFAEKFLTSVDDPMGYGVYFLFHDWWAEAPQEAIDAYLAELASIPESRAFIDQGYISEPLSIERLAACQPGTLGHGYHKFIIDNKLEANLGKNYREMNEKLHDSGTLDRLPEDMSYMMIRGFQIHDFQHVLAGYDSSPLGELAIAAFYLAQLRFPYHAMRMAVTTAHMAFMNPSITVGAMGAIVDGWAYGRAAKNLNFTIWEDEIDTPLEVLRERMGLRVPSLAA